MAESSDTSPGTNLPEPETDWSRVASGPSGLPSSTPTAAERRYRRQRNCPHPLDKVLSTPCWPESITQVCVHSLAEEVLPAHQGTSLDQLARRESAAVTWRSAPSDTSPQARARLRGGASLIGIFPEPFPSSRVRLHHGVVAFVAEGDTDPVHLPVEQIFYRPMLARTPATSASDSATGLHSGSLYHADWSLSLAPIALVEYL